MTFLIFYMKEFLTLYKNAILIFLATLLLCSCDDGDIIITSFEFDNSDLQMCTGAETDEFVFFKINSGINESISFNFINPRYEQDSITGEEPIVITLSENNPLIYRKYSSSITADYFCATIPPANIEIIDELVISQGKVYIEVKIAEEDDEDGVPAEEEDINGNGNLEDDDTDGDQIPNYKDQDDDGDNVLTSAELPNDIPGDNSYKNTDGDNIPDYLDSDDDNDDIPTKEEDADRNGSPRNDDVNDNKILDYLDSTINISYGEPVQKLDNTIKTTFRTTINFFELVAPRNADQFNEDNLDMGYRDFIKSITRPATDNPED